MGAFSELSRSMNGGDKIFKYKQGKMIECIQTYVSTDEYQVGKGGVCCTLTMRWLAQRLGAKVGTSDSGFGQGEAGSMDRDISDIETTQQSVIMYNHLKEVQSLRGKSSALRKIAKRYGLKLDTQDVDDPSKFEGLTEIIDGCVMEAGILSNSHYIGFSVHDSGGTAVGTHAIGVAGVDGDALFFDPNIGEYKVSDAAKFGKSYLACYANSSLGWNLSKSMAFRCLAQV